MISLKILHAEYGSNIDQCSIQNIKLYELRVSYNQKITDVSKMTSLKILYAINSGINKTNIVNLNLDKLYI